jgi:hypothetical protein
MRLFALLLLLSTSIFALPAPYLISTTAVSDTSIGLSWRNNSTSTTGFYVLRKQAGQTNYTIIDSAGPAITAFSDIKLVSSTKYYYRIIAFSATELSDSSNIDSATTLASVCPTCTPSLFYPNTIYANLVVSMDTVKQALSVSIEENACDDEGAILIRSFNGGPFDTVNKIFRPPLQSHAITSTTTLSGIRRIFILTSISGIG